MHDVAADRAIIAAATPEEWMGVQCSSCYTIKTMRDGDLVNIGEFDRKKDGVFAVQARTRWSAVLGAYETAHADALCYKDAWEQERLLNDALKVERDSERAKNDRLLVALQILADCGCMNSTPCDCYHACVAREAIALNGGTP